jgi:hypothetical protein
MFNNNLNGNCYFSILLLYQCFTCSPVLATENNNKSVRRRTEEDRGKNFAVYKVWQGVISSKLQFRIWYMYDAAIETDSD